MEYETRLDAPSHPYCKDERHHCRGDKNSREKGLLPKQVEHWKDDGEDEQLRQEPSDQHAPPPQPCGFHIRRILAVTPLSDAIDVTSRATKFAPRHDSYGSRHRIGPPGRHMGLVLVLRLGTTWRQH